MLHFRSYRTFSFGMVPVGSKAASSLKGTEKIAQGKAEGRHPGNTSQTSSDPEGVEQTAPEDVAPLQGADVGADVSPGFHPGLLSSSPSATGGVYRVIGQPEDLTAQRNSRKGTQVRLSVVEDLLAGKTIDLPPNLQTFKQAEKVVAGNKDQGSLRFS